MVKILFLFIVIFLNLSSLLSPLDPQKSISQYKLDIWAADEGLPLNVIFDIEQTVDGCLWLGTRDGLVRFDGIAFKVFNSSSSREFTGDIVKALCQDREGGLWIGTQEAGLYRCKDGAFTHYSSKEHPPLKRITALVEDQKGALWIGTASSGVSRLQGGRLTAYTTRQGLISDRVRSIHADSSGSLWIGAPAGVTLLTADSRGDYSGRPSFSFSWVHYIYERGERELWFASTDGLYQQTDRKLSRYELPAALPTRKIIYLYEDSDRNFWLGTDGGGLLRKKNGTFEIFSTAHGLACANVFSIFEDREGSLWLGTLKGGLHRLRDTPVTPFTTKEGLSHDYVNCFCEDRSGSLLIGTQAGLDRLQDGKVTRVLSGKQGLLSSIVNSILEDRSGGLWIGTPAGLHRFKDGKLTRFTTRNGLCDNHITVLREDRQKALWIGTANGLNRFYEDKFKVYDEVGSLIDQSVTCLFEDSQGNLWIGTVNGLGMMRSGTFTTYTTKEGLADNHIECIYEDEEGLLYFGTRGGLSRLAHGSFFNYTSRCGLITSRVNYILEDSQGNLWLAGPSGISRVKKKELADVAAKKRERIAPQTYNEQDGMKTRWCGSEGLKTRDGRLWFATTKGAAMIDPADIEKNTLAPPVAIEELKVDGEAVDIGPGEVVIGPGKKRLEFYYTALSYIKPRKVKFKLKLTGYEDDWVDVGSDRSTNYTGLSPGKYTFKVTAGNADGVWNEAGASLSFLKKPHWYETWWAFLAYVLSILVGVFSFVKWRSWKLVREKKQLEQEVKERTKEVYDKNILLEEQSEKLKEMDRVKSRFFANISHEFRTPLTLIMGPLEQRLSESKDTEQRDETQMMLKSSQRLLGLINQLLDLSKLDSGKMVLHAAPQDIVAFLKGLFNSFESLAVQEQLQLKFQAEEEILTLYFDAEKMEKVFANLLVNACKFTPAGGEISLAIERDGDFAAIAVRDSGIGIPEDQAAHIFDRFYQAEKSRSRHYPGTGIGLSLVKELVELHHGEIAVQSRQGAGTVFTIRLPLGSDHLKPEEIAAEGESAPTLEISREIERAASEEKKEQEEEIASEEIDKEEREKDVILVVDDNADVRKYIRRPLKAHYTVVEAADGKQGIEKAKTIIPDLIISDVMMPEVDGYELCGVLKKDVQTSHIPIILLTAKASEQSMIDGLKTGADDYITKPFNTKILLTRIQNLIDLRRGLQEKIQREMVLQPSEIAVSSVDQEFMKELKQALEKNLSEPEFGVDELAETLVMGRATLNRKIRAITGESTNQFIQSYRLKRAAQLLKANFGNVTEVAFEVGFSNSAYFSKCFKEKFLQLPHLYQAAEG